MRWNVFLIAIVCLLTCTAGSRSDPAPDPALGPAILPGPAILEVVNDAGKVFTFTAAELAKLPQKELKAKDHSGDEATYSGVLVAEVLKKADVTLGERLRGKLLTNHLIIEASDKYRVLFSLPEIDPDWTENITLLATSRNGKALDEKHGPLQVVVPGDKRHSRWVKQVTRLTVRSENK